MGTRKLVEMILADDGFYENNPPDIIKEYTLKALKQLKEERDVANTLYEDELRFHSH